MGPGSSGGGDQRAAAVIRAARRPPSCPSGAEAASEARLRAGFIERDADRGWSIRNPLLRTYLADLYPS